MMHLLTCSEMAAERSAASVFVQEIKGVAQSMGPRMLTLPVPLGATGGWYLARVTNQQGETQQRECKTTRCERGLRGSGFPFLTLSHSTVLASPCTHKALHLVVKLLQQFFFLGGEVVLLPSAATSVRCLKCILFTSSNRIRSPSLRGEVTMPLCITYHFSDTRASLSCAIWFCFVLLCSQDSLNYFASISLLRSKYSIFLNMTLFIYNFFTEPCSVHRK